MHCLVVWCCLMSEAFSGHEEQVQPSAPPLATTLQPFCSSKLHPPVGECPCIMLLIVCHATVLEVLSFHCALQARAVLVGQWGFGQDGRDMGGTVCLFTGGSMAMVLVYGSGAGLWQWC